MRTLEDLGDLSGARVVLRCDLNVPLKDGVITDEGRILASLETIQELLRAGASVVVLSHLGRPEGVTPALSLQPVATRLGELLDEPVSFVADTVGEAAREASAALEPGSVLLLENVRFFADETSKDAEVRLGFARQLAEHGTHFVLDGFGVAHRKQASVSDIATLLPSASGRLVQRELDVLSRLTSNVTHPYTVVLGGSKVSDKLGVIEHLLPRVDHLVIGGGMMYTFLAAQGHKVGQSLLEEDQIPQVLEYLKRAEELGVKIHLPVDAVVADAFAADANTAVVAAGEMESTSFGDQARGLDIGPQTTAAYAGVISSSATVFWNGPMGVFEFEAFAAGTRGVAQALTEVKGLGVVGGGDSAAAVRQLGFADNQFGHISTGGGASLEFLEGKSMPGLEALGWK